MQYKLSLLCCLLFSDIIMWGQQKSLKVPPRVIKAFEKSFPSATHVRWEKENEFYEVSFKNANQQMSALFDVEGIWKETEVTIPVNALPASVRDYVKAHYKSAVIREATRITKQGNVIAYEAEVNSKDLLFDEKGNPLK